MARIFREYDDKDILEGLTQVGSEVILPSNASVTNIDVDDAMHNADYRIVRLEVEVVLPRTEFEKVFDSPIG